MERITQSAHETQKLGQEIASRLKGGETIALVGDLGAGKTTFTQGLAEGLGIKDRIISPTFILMRNYDNLYHIDLYRLEDNVWEEAKNLGVEEIWQDSENIVLIEWAEKIKDHLPEDTIYINFEPVGDNERKINIIGMDE